MVFYLISGSPALISQLFQAYPDQDGTSDMITLNPFFATLALVKPSHWLGLPMKRLNLPTKAACLLDRRRRILRPVVGDDLIRALGRK